MSAVAVVPEPWEAYAEGTRADHFAWWCAEHCVQSIDVWEGQRLDLEPWQLAIFAEALAEVSAFESYWRVVALVIPKKNGKTSMLAAYALYHLVEDQGSPEVLLAAATDSQAGRLFDTAVRFVRSDPWLSARLVVREHEGQIRRVDGFGCLYRVSADSGALSGYNPSLLVADELGDWTTPRRRRAWASMVTGGQVARRNTHVFVISTAGEPADRIDGALGSLIDGNEMDGDVEHVHRALTISRNHAGRTLVYNYSAPTLDPHDTAAIKDANPASWVTAETLAQLASSPTLTAGRYLQLHACVWTSAEGSYVEIDEWRTLAVEDRLRRGDQVVLGFRGGESCALVACRLSDGLVEPLSIWPATAEPDAEDVDDALLAAVEEYRVRLVFASATPEWATLVDSWRSTLGKRAVVDVAVHLPSPRSAEITLRFRADVRSGRLHHTGDRTLARHVLGAQMARSRNLPYLVGDARRSEPISACQAALLAWEARALLGPGAARVRSKVPVSA